MGMWNRIAGAVALSVVIAAVPSGTRAQDPVPVEGDASAELAPTPPTNEATMPPADEATMPPVAPDAPPAPTPPARPKSEVALELAMHAGSITGGTIFGFSPLLRASIQVHDNVAVEATMVFPYASVSPDGGSGASALHIGNPWLAGYYTGAFGKLKLRLGAGVGIPLASLPDVDPMDPASVANRGAAQAAYAEGAGVRGVWVPWLWPVDYLTIGLPLLTATYTVTPNMNIVGDVGFAYLLYIGDDTAKKNRTWMRFGAAASYTAGIVQAGLRFQAAWFPSDDGDNAQLAIEPFARFNFGVPFVRVGFLMNLDKPRGFAFSENGIWGLRLEGGASF